MGWKYNNDIPDLLQFRLWVVNVTLLLYAANSASVVVLKSVGVFQVPMYHAWLHAGYGWAAIALIIGLRRRPDHLRLISMSFLVILLASLVSTDFLDIPDTMRFTWHGPGTAAAMVIGGVWIGLAFLMVSIASVLTANAVYDVLAPQDIMTFVITHVLTFVALTIFYRQMVNTMANLAASRNEMKRLAETDPLTSLANRKVLTSRIQDMATAHHPFAVILLDLDWFKSVNDTYGHGVGDQVLIETARCMVSNVRPGDLVARFGGEEFCVLLPDTDPDTARDAADALRMAIAAHTVVADETALQITASVGIAHSSPPHCRVAQILAAADDALYQSKRAGRNRCTLAPSPQWAAAQFGPVPASTSSGTDR